MSRNNLLLPHQVIQKIEHTLFYLLILFLPTQLGKHFWPDFSIVSGIRIDYLSPTLYVTDLLTISLFGCWLFNVILSEVKDPRKKILRLRLRMTSRTVFISKFFIMFLFLLFSILFSQGVPNGAYHLLKLLEFSLLGFYVARFISNTGRLQKVVLCLSAAAIFESALAIAQFLNQASIGGLFYFFGERTFNSLTPGIANASINGELILRPYATFSHPNVLAGFLLIAMTMAFWMFGLRKHVVSRHLGNSERSVEASRIANVKSQFSGRFWTSQNDFVFVVCILLGTAALFLTMSRVAILLWILILFVSFFKQAFSGKNKYVVFFVLFALLGSYAISPADNRVLATKLTEESVVQRQELITSSLKLFSENPIFGVGLGNFIPSLVDVQRPFSPTLYLQPVHNIFLLVLVEAGIIGFSFFVWFVIKTYKRLLRHAEFISASNKIPKQVRDDSYVFLILLSEVLILSLFDHYFLTLQQGQLLLAVILGICWTKKSSLTNGL